MQIRRIPAPNLPLVPNLYERQYGEQLNKDLRLYFTRLGGAVNALLDPSGGGSSIAFPHGEFVATNTQAAAVANTPQIVDLSGTEFSSLMYYQVGDGIHVDREGIYEIAFSAQFANTDGQEHDAGIWLRRGGVDVANTASFVTVPKTHAGGDGKALMAASFFVQMAAGDYVELWWAAGATTVSLEAVAASSLPFTHPTSPAMVVTMTFVSNLE